MGPDFIPKEFTMGVGGAVVRDNRLLMVKHNYGPRKWQIPGGLVRLNETVDQAVVREIAEETGIRAITEGIFAVRHRLTEAHNNVYVVFKCRTDDTHDPVPDAREVSDAAFLTLDEIEGLTETWNLNRFLGRAILVGQPHLFTDQGDPEDLDRIYKLFC
jgi:8-oxo-dGTP diphosphatase